VNETDILIPCFALAQRGSNHQQEGCSSGVFRRPSLVLFEKYKHCLCGTNGAVSAPQTHVRALYLHESRLQLIPAADQPASDANALPKTHKLKRSAGVCLCVCAEMVLFLALIFCLETCYHHTVTLLISVPPKK